MIKSLALLFLALVAVSVSAQTTQPPGTVAFIDVNVIPMDRQRVVPHQTVEKPICHPCLSAAFKIYFTYSQCHGS